MTFRVQRSTVDDALVLMLSGDIAGDHTADLETLVNAGERPIVLDLKDVSVVDRAGVLLLARSEARGATLLNCPSYVREWILREGQFTHFEQRAGSGRSEEHSMASGAAIEARERRLNTRAWISFLLVAAPDGRASWSRVHCTAGTAWAAERLWGPSTHAGPRGRAGRRREHFCVDTFVLLVSDVAALVDLVKSETRAFRVPAR
jgi:hypothetical protein